MTACPEGHFEYLEETPWPAGSRVHRPDSFTGLVGEPAHLFDDSQRVGVTSTPVNHANLRWVIDRMVGGFGR
ncbi:MAG TPA: hypothetical protein VM142_07450 [Acidimicrobiales bacterium]|nr:hypothetical protein [Acidimicrobiales bacterium]